MPVFDCDSKTDRMGQYRSEFVVYCDGNDDDRLVFSFWQPNDDDKDDGYELYLTILPDQYPMHFLQRLNYAWSVLTTGRRRHVDDMVFERETVVGFAERLLSIAGKMKSRGRPHFHSPLSPT